MRLYLVQHGDALSKDLDPKRPLSAKGRRDVARLGEELARSTLTVERILHSGKLRAKETAETICAALGERQSRKRFVPRLVNANRSKASLASDLMIRSKPSCRSLRIGGRTPSLSGIYLSCPSLSAHWWQAMRTPVSLGSSPAPWFVWNLPMMDPGMSSGCYVPTL